VYCSVLVWGFATSGWTTHYKWGCQEIDYSNNPQAYRMASVFWYTHILKIVDLVEAIFFILRKKFNQVSALHVYHHVSMVYTSWIATKYCAGGMVSFYPMLNNIVHVVMYTYYLLATLGPDMQKKLAKFKPKITMMQMIQFTIFLIHVSTSIPSTCHVPKKTYSTFRTKRNGYFLHVLSVLYENVLPKAKGQIVPRIIMYVVRKFGSVAIPLNKMRTVTIKTNAVYFFSL